MAKNSAAIALAVIAGILLLISGVSGFTTWQDIQAFLTEHIIDDPIVHYIFVILLFIASLGGISVIIGALLVRKEKIRTGKLFISLGAGLGIIGLIITIFITLYEGSFTLGSFLSIGSIGLILSIAARLMIKKE